MSYADRSEQAQQEQLDWLHEIHEEAVKQTGLLTRIAKHTALLYGLAVVWIVLVAIYVLARLFDLAN